MSDFPGKMRFHVESRRIDAHESGSECRTARIGLDTDMAGNPEAFNPAELLLAALSACMIKGIERVVPILKYGTVFNTVAPGTDLSGVMRRA